MLTVTMVEQVFVLSFLLAWSTGAIFGWGINKACIIGDTSPLATLYRLSFISCAHKCNCLPGCKFANYKHMQDVCQIYTTHVNVSDKTCSNYTLLTREDAQALLTRTKNRTCAENETTYCSDSELDAANADIYGNVNTIGAKRLKVCHHTNEMQGENTTVCTEANGTAKWSELGECVSTVVTCDRPLVTDNMNVTLIQAVTPNGTVTYTHLDSVEFPLLENSTVSMWCMLGDVEYGEDMITCVGGTWTEERPCAGALRRTCDDDNDCTVLYSVCKGRQCWCEPGRSFDPSTSACVDDCSEQYGNTFQIVPNTKIIADRVGFPPATNVTDCINQCLHCTRCNCTHAIFRSQIYTHTVVTSCFLYEILPTSSEIRLIPSTNEFTFLQRDCARRHV